MRLPVIAGVAFLCLMTWGCTHPSRAHRHPSQAHDHAAFQGSDAFHAAEEVPRQHNFIFADPKGHFGYHITEFESNHQHQFIIKGKLISTTPDELNQLKPTQTKIAGQPQNSQGHKFFSITSDKPRFLLKVLRDGEVANFPVDVYDGFIGSGTKIETEARYVIEQEIFESPMHLEELRPDRSTYIVFGGYDKPQTRYYLAHLIKGDNNFEQVVAVDLKEELEIGNASLLRLDMDDTVRLKTGEYVGTIDDIPVKFTVTKIIYESDKKGNAKY